MTKEQKFYKVLQDVFIGDKKARLDYKLIKPLIWWE